MVNSQTTYLENMPVMAKPRIWDTATEMPKLAWDEVHVWRVCLDDSALFLERLISVLSIDETNRANRYCFLADRNHFILARGVLRIILGSYLNMNPTNCGFLIAPIINRYCPINWPGMCSTSTYLIPMGLGFAP